MPICLPGISEQGYIQFYSNFSEENIGVIFVTENMDPMCFVKFQEQYNRLYQKLNSENYIEKLMNSFRINNNIFGEFSLIKEKNKKKEEKEKSVINAEFLMNELINKMSKGRNLKLLPKKSDKHQLVKLNTNIDIHSNNNKLNQTNTENNIFSKIDDADILKKRSSFRQILGKNEKLINKVFEGIKYGVILNKKLRQYILLNFGMDFRTLDKLEKKLIHEYNILYDKANEQVNENEEFFFIEKSEEFVNVIEVNENFLIICSYNFFSDYDEIGKKTKDLIKYMKKNENKHFIVFK